MSNEHRSKSHAESSSNGPTRSLELCPGGQAPLPTVYCPLPTATTAHGPLPCKLPARPPKLLYAGEPLQRQRWDGRQILLLASASWSPSSSIDES